MQQRTVKLMVAGLLVNGDREFQAAGAMMLKKNIYILRVLGLLALMSYLM